VIQSSRDIPLFLDGERVKAGKNAKISLSRSQRMIVPQTKSAKGTVLAQREVKIGLD
jgi:hypothetical protein